MNRFLDLYLALERMGLIKSQQDFANATGLSRSVVSFLYLGKRNLTDKHIRLICEGFHSVNPQWLRNGEGEMFNYDPKESFDIEADTDWDAVVKDWVALHTTSDGKVDASGGPDDEDSRVIEYISSKASLYDMKSEEVKELYSRLSDKEEEIAKLHRTIQRQALKIQLLQKQIAGLKTGRKTPDQTPDDNPSLV